MTGRQEFGVHMNLHHTTLNDLPFLCEIEQRFAKLGFVHSDNLCTHQHQMNDPDYAYYTVEQGEGFVGYVILRGLSSINHSLELKRIVIADPGKGLGRQVLLAVIDRAFGEFRANRLWLDVYEDNHRARHVYRSLGFVEETTSANSPKNGRCHRALVIMSISKAALKISSNRILLVREETA